MLFHKSYIFVIISLSMILEKMLFGLNNDFIFLIYSMLLILMSGFFMLMFICNLEVYLNSSLNKFMPMIMLMSLMSTILNMFNTMFNYWVMLFFDFNPIFMMLTISMELMILMLM